MIYLGIDPGSRFTGYAFLEKQNRGIKVLEYGVIKCGEKRPLIERIGVLVKQLDELCQCYHPSALVIEEVFFAKNAKSALILGQARGAILGVVSQLNIPVYELSAKEVKQAVTGRGASDKGQVALMMQRHLNLKEIPQSEDASDALAIAWVGTQFKGV